MSRKTGKEMANEVSDFVNSAVSYEKEEFVTSVMSDHRLLQDEMFGMFFNCIKMWAEAYEQDNYDFRNSRACKASYEMVEALKNNGWD